MASYIRGWIYGESQSSEATNVPSIETSAPPHDADSDSDTVHGDDDAPPAFPAMNSAQRAVASLRSEEVPRILSDSQLMPPPPVPSLVARRPGVASGPSLSSSLLPPPTTTKPPPKVTKRAKVALAPGHGPLDWANLKKSGQNLRVRPPCTHVVDECVMVDDREQIPCSA